MGLKSTISIIVIGLALAGCNRSINSIAPGSSQPQRLPAAPVEPVSSSDLPPPIDGVDVAGTENATAPQAPTAPTTTNVDQTQIASTDAPAPSGEPVTREGVSGAWTVASDNPECRMILAFTKWSGGYRAAQKRCQSSELASVSAWDVKGQQVVLMDASGNSIARLYHSGGERYDGTLNSGEPISFSR